MVNYINIKVTLLQHKNVSNELYIDYCNKDGEFVGNIIVNSQGKIEWHILDATYQNIILNTVIYINNDKNNQLLDYEATNLDKRRWNRAILFAVNRGLYSNIKSKSDNSDSKVKIYKR